MTQHSNFTVSSLYEEAVSSPSCASVGQGTPSSTGRSGMASTSKTSPSPVVVNRLRSDLRAATNEINNLKVEIRTLQGIIATKDDAIEVSDAARKAAEEQALDVQGKAASLEKALEKLKHDREQLRKERDHANVELDKLSQEINLGNGAGNGNLSDSAQVAELHNQLSMVSTVDITSLSFEIHDVPSAFTVKSNYAMRRLCLRSIVGPSPCFV